MTGLANRSRFSAVLSARLTTAQPGSAAVLHLDLDGSKAINDTDGHAVGDTVLSVVTHRLCSPNLLTRRC